MANKYEWNTNPFNDYLIASLLLDNDITEKEMLDEIYDGFCTIIDYFTGNETDSEYLNFEIKEKNGFFKVVSGNAITAFWLSGIFPDSIRQVNRTNEFIFDDMEYKFNPKTKKISKKQLKN